MAISQEYYSMDFSLNGVTAELVPEEISFVISDSIYSLYNYGKVIIQDSTGGYQEYFATTEGAKFSINYGSIEKTNACPFVIKDDHIDKMDTAGLLAGSVGINIVNKWYIDQKIKSKSYKAPIHSIINSIVSMAGFASLEIEATGNDDYWYQMMTTDAKFIKEMLLPNAYSNSSETPFYAYITNDNIFHLKSLKSMMKSNPTTTIKYNIPSKDDTDNDFTLQVRRWHQSSDKHRKFLNRNIYKISRTDGTLVESSDSIRSYPPNNAESIPIMNHGDQDTGYINLGFDRTESGASQNLDGEIINSQRDSIFLERFLLTYPLNPNLHSGETIQFNVYTADNQREILSPRHSGKYVIESCEHLWDRESRRGSTKLIIGRKYIGSVPSTYVIKPLLI